MRCSTTLGISLAAAFAAVVVGSSAAAAATVPITATYGRAEVAVSDDPASSGARQLLTYKASDNRAAVAVAARLPAEVTRLGLGLDATGLLTAVVQTPSGLSWVHVTKPDGFKRIAKTAGAQSPAIYKGRVAYVCQGERAVCQASLRTKARRVLYRQPKGSSWIIDDVRIGAGNAIAMLEIRDGALGASQVDIKRPGASPKRIAQANLDAGEDLALRDISPDSTHLSLVRVQYGDEPPTETLQRFRFPSGAPAS